MGPVIHIWLDDVRDPKHAPDAQHVENWVWCKDHWEFNRVFFQALKEERVIGRLSFDHYLKGRVTGTEMARDTLFRIETYILDETEGKIHFSPDFIVESHSSDSEYHKVVKEWFDDLIKEHGVKIKELTVNG